MGSRGASSGIGGGKSTLSAFKENAKQFNEAIQKAKAGKYYQLQYTDLTGKTVNRYWTGGNYSDRPSALYADRNRKAMPNGTLRLKFRKKKNK